MRLFNVGKLILLTAVLIALLARGQEAQYCSFDDQASLETCSATSASNIQAACTTRGQIADPGPNKLAHGGLSFVSALTPSFFKRYVNREDDDDTAILRGGDFWISIVVGIFGILALVSLFAYAIPLFYCRCYRSITQKGSNSKDDTTSKIGPKALSGLVGLFVFLSLLACHIYTSHLHTYVNHTDCTVLQTAHNYFYGTASVSNGKIFKGYSSLLQLVKILPTACQIQTMPLAASAGKVGAILQSAFPGILAPLLWTDQMLSSTPYYGWLDPTGQDTVFTMGLTIPKAATLRTIWTTASGTGVSPGHVHAALPSLTATFDLATLAEEEAVLIEHVHNLEKDFVDAIPNLNKFSKDMVDVARTIQKNRSTKLNALYVVLTLLYVFTWIALVAGGYYFYRYLRRNTPSDPPSPGMRIVTILSIFGCFAWLALGALVMIPAYLPSDACPIVKKDFLEGGRYLDFPKVKNHLPTLADQRMINHCVVDTADGDLLAARDINTNLSGYEPMTWDVVTGLNIAPTASLDTARVLQYLRENAADLTSMQVISAATIPTTLPAAIRTVTLTDESLYAYATALNAMVDTSYPYRFCPILTEAACPFFASASQVVPLNITTLYNDVTGSRRMARDSRIAKAFDALVTGTTETDFGFALRLGVLRWMARETKLKRYPRTEYTAPWVWDYCVLGTECDIFWAWTGPQRVEEVDFDSWSSSNVVGQLQSAVAASTVADLLTRCLVIVMSVNPLTVIQHVAANAIASWNCRYVFDIIHYYYQIACRNIGADLAILGWFFMLLGGCYGVVSIMTLIHWQRHHIAEES